ncbi:MAG: hypothetical protein ACJ74H_05205 [Thermoanaerobaculia bacterium]
MEALQRLIAALWLGSAFFLMLSAQAAFRAAGNTSIAADVVGSILTRWHYIALAAPLALFALELRRARPLILIVLFVAIVLAAGQSFVDLRIRSIRASSPVSISSLDRTDPVRRRFGALHGLSMMLLLAQTLIAASVVLAGSSVPRRSSELLGQPAAVDSRGTPRTSEEPEEPPIADTTGGGP